MRISHLLALKRFSHLFRRPKLIDGRLPISVIPGMVNVVPWNTVTTQVATSNWPAGRNSFFLELEGVWYVAPSEDVRILDSDGPTTGFQLLKLSKQEIKKALRFAIANWPTLSPPQEPTPPKPSIPYESKEALDEMRRG